MKTTEISTRPAVVACWGDQDERFFRLVRRIFSAEFLVGAGVLLASNDDE